MVCFAKYDTLFTASLTSDELVFLQPVEYNSYFAGACISWRRDANGGAWQPHYRITDHLGSTRLETSANGTITAAYDYKPFGEQIPLMTSKTRKTYIGKERDDESYLGDFGVRKYDYAAGRFTSPDVLWEKYINWSPYQYCGNNPISESDPTGLNLIFYYRAPNYFSLDPGHISFEVTDEEGKTLGSWSFTPKNNKSWINVWNGTPSKQSDINYDKLDKNCDKKLELKTSISFDKIILNEMDKKKKLNEDYILLNRNCVTTTLELLQTALDKLNTGINLIEEDRKIMINIPQDGIYINTVRPILPSEGFNYIKEHKPAIESALKK